LHYRVPVQVVSGELRPEIADLSPGSTVRI
jgi:hypothetical protein